MVAVKTRGSSKNQAKYLENYMVGGGTGKGISTDVYTLTYKDTTRYNLKGKVILLPTWTERECHDKSWSSMGQGYLKGPSPGSLPMHKTMEEPQFQPSSESSLGVVRKGRRRKQML